MCNNLVVVGGAAAWHCLHCAPTPPPHLVCAPQHSAAQGLSFSGSTRHLATGASSTGRNPVPQPLLPARTAQAIQAWGGGG